MIYDLIGAIGGGLIIFILMSPFIVAWYVMSKL
jgi:hypothetical protein